MFAVYGFIENAIFRFVGVVNVDCFLVYLRFFYFCVVKTVHYRYTKCTRIDLFTNCNGKKGDDRKRI